MLPYFVKLQIEGKAMNDLIERIEYKSYEANSLIVSQNTEQDRLFILLDGTVDIQVDVASSQFKDKYIQEITKDTGFCKNMTFKKLNQFRAHHKLT